MHTHNHAVGEEVWVVMTQAEYNGKVLEKVDGLCIIRDLARSMTGKPVYIADVLDSEHPRRIRFTDFHIREDAPIPERLKDHAHSIADYLALDGVDSEQVQTWITLLRGHANGRP